MPDVSGSPVGSARNMSVVTPRIYSDSLPYWGIVRLGDASSVLYRRGLTTLTKGERRHVL